MNKPFSLFLILFLFIFQTAVFSADQACELIDKSWIKTIHIANFLPASIVQDVNVKVSAGYTEKQAKGIVGELIARTEIEEGKISVPGDPRERKSIEKGLISPEYPASGQGILGRAATYSIAFIGYHSIGNSVANRHLAAHLAARVGPAQRNT